MDLEDLFDNDRRNGKRGRGDRDDNHDRRRDKNNDDDDHRDHRFGNDDDDDEWGDHRKRHRDDDDDMFDLENIAHKLLANKKLLIIAVIALVAVLAIAVIFILPLLGQATDYVDKNGVKGVVERVWDGSGGGK
jgi:hypothetical protein